MDHVSVVIPGCVYVYRRWLDRESSHAIQGMLELELASHLRPHRGFRGWLDRNRLTARFGDSGTTYKYGTRSYPLLAFGEQLDALRRTVENEADHLFNVAYVNKYLNGDAALARHSDIPNLPQLGQEPVVASVSFGEARRFQFWSAADPKNKAKMVETTLEDGDLCIMRGRSQLDWLHAVPREKGLTGSRLSVTFRWHNAA